MTSLAPRRGRQLIEQRAGRGGRATGDPLVDLQNRMGDLLQSFFGDPFFAGPMAPVVPVWVPPFDIEETQDSYILEMDLPGVRPEDVNIELIGTDTLRVTGRYAGRERTGAMRRQERRGGREGGAEFEYDVVLPGETNPDQIGATLEHGVLAIHAGKAQPQARRIQVKAGEAGGGAEAGGRTAPVAGGATEAVTGGVSSTEAPPAGSQTRVSPGDSGGVARR